MRLDTLLRRLALHLTVIAWSDADAFFGMGRLGGSLSLGESDAWGSRADINVCQTAERLASCTVHVS